MRAVGLSPRDTADCDPGLTWSERTRRRQRITLNVYLHVRRYVIGLPVDAGCARSSRSRRSGSGCPAGSTRPLSSAPRASGPRIGRRGFIAHHSSGLVFLWPRPRLAEPSPARPSASPGEHRLRRARLHVARADALPHVVRHVVRRELADREDGVAHPRLDPHSSRNREAERAFGPAAISPERAVDRRPRLCERRRRRLLDGRSPREQPRAERAMARRAHRANGSLDDARHESILVDWRGWGNVCVL